MNANDPSPIEDRLRQTLRSVAATTVVPDPDEATSLGRAGSSPVVVPLDGGDRTSRNAWRLAGAAALVLVLLASVAVLTRGSSSVTLPPAGSITSTTSGTSAGPSGTTTPSSAEELDANGVPVRPSAQLVDHWHAAYGIYVCDHFLSPLSDVREDRLGIHTHGEGIIHIHPFTSEASGRNATFRLFTDQVGIQLAGNGLRLPDGRFLVQGMNCNAAGGAEATYRIYSWRVDDPNAPPEVYTDLSSIRFTADRMAFTIAFVPDGVVPPKPDSIAELDKLSDVVPPDTALTSTP